MTTATTLSGRDRAILRAVAAGGAELQLGAEPDLFLDGRCCCDQTAAHYLVHAGLIAATLGVVLKHQSDQQRAGAELRLN